MERLTKRSGEMVWLKRGELFLEPCEVLSDCDGRDIRNVLVHMAAYEDTGLTPEEISKLKSIASWADTVEHELEKYMEIEKAERLVILPCKVTETVYVIEDVFERKKAVGKRVAPALIDHVTIGGTTGKPVYDLCTKTGGWYYSMEPEDFYLTREAAEAALKEQEG